MKQRENNRFNPLSIDNTKKKTIKLDEMKENKQKKITT
jgi:hypothetical protein